jgi:DNA helicase-2/ATP-dependent DNA helicase PcrA
MPNREKLTDQQLKILHLQHDRHVVLAPPGSGKTELLGLRVSDALERGVAADSMLCITFTNRAARNMMQRVGDLGIRAPFIGTLHRFGLRFLLANQLVPAATGLLDEEDAHQLLNEAAAAARQELNLATTPLDLFKITARVRQASLEARRLASADMRPAPDVLLDRVVENYVRMKDASCAIDFDDVLHLMLQALRFSEPLEMRGYRWVQVDEVQDLSDIQWDILSRLVAQDGHVVYFGDYDQSIFSFMGASQDALARFTADSTHHHLQDNFRSPPYLIDFFNAYARANMPARRIEELKFNAANRHTGGKVLVHRAHGEFADEAWDIARSIVPQMSQQLGNVAVLTRTNKDADTISDALTKRRIDHRRVSGFDLFRRRTIKDVMAFLRAMGDARDRLAWTRLLAAFGGVTTLRESRTIINELFAAALNPADWLRDGSSADCVDRFTATLRRGRCVVFDTETTGLNLAGDDIVQIAAVEIVDGRPSGRFFEAYLHTDRDLGASAAVHHITAEVLAARGQPARQALASFLEFVGDAPLGGHNSAEFDLPMLAANLARAGLTRRSTEDDFDTLGLARRLHPALTSYRLATLLAAMQLEGNNTHNALDDVHATVALAAHLCRQAEAHAARRVELRQRHDRLISRLAQTLGPLWRRALDRKATDMNLADLMDEFFSHAGASIGYRVDEQESSHIRVLTGFLRRHGSHKPLAHHLQNLVRDLATYSEADLITDDIRVVVSTIHKAKGLEFDGVVVTSCVRDVYPHYYSQTTEALGEDSRLLYVGITRARQQVVLTAHDTVVNRGGRFPRGISPFLQFLDAAPGVEPFPVG